MNAGLPNIKGTANGGVYSAEEPSSVGAFGATKHTVNNTRRTGELYEIYVYDRTFDASRSNPIYGRSSTVQPAAYYVHIWHRVA